MGRKAKNPVQEAVWRDIRAQFPGFREAVRADAGMTALNRGERFEFRSRGDAIMQALRLCWVSDAFLALVFYRAKATLQAREVPVLPRILHKLAMATAQLSIGDPVILRAGVYIVHGQVVLDGIVDIGPGAVISPWVSIGLRAGNVQGPVIERDVRVGTGAVVVGPLHIGANAQIGANAVVTRDVAPGTTVVGVPAREVKPRQPA